MSTRNQLSSICLPSEKDELKSDECSNESEILSISSISKKKKDEIKRLLASVMFKHEKYNILLQYDGESDLLAKVIRKELLENYALNSNCHDYNPQANVLFGLSEVDIDRQSSTEELSFQKKQCCTLDLSKSLFTGFNAKLNFPPKLLLKKIEVLKTLLSLYKNQASTLSCLEEYKATAAKVRELLLLKQQTAITAAEAYQKGLYSLCIEAQLQKYMILKDYFSEDKGIVDASYKLRECITSEYENLRWKEIELQNKIQAFKRLQGPKFDQLLRDYRIVCESISNKEWTLQNLI